MSVFRTRFRAKANMSLPEAARRMGAALGDGVHHRELPPSIIAERLSASVLPFPATDEQDPKVLSGAPETAGEACTEAVTAGETAPICPQTSEPTDAQALRGPGVASGGSRPLTSEPNVNAAAGVTAGRDRQPPVVTITISGEDGTTIISHLIRAELARHGIAFEGPEDLQSMNWRAGLDRHLRKGTRVVLVREVVSVEREAAE